MSDPAQKFAPKPRTTTVRRLGSLANERAVSARCSQSAVVSAFLRSPLPIVIHASVFSCFEATTIRLLNKSVIELLSCDAETRLRQRHSPAQGALLQCV